MWPIRTQREERSHWPARTSLSSVHLMLIFPHSFFSNFFFFLFPPFLQPWRPRTTATNHHQPSPSACAVSLGTETPHSPKSHSQTTTGRLPITLPLVSHLIVVLHIFRLSLTLSLVDLSTSQLNTTRPSSWYPSSLTKVAKKLARFSMQSKLYN